MKNGFFIILFSLLFMATAWCQSIKSVNFIQEGDVSKLIIEVDGEVLADRFHVKDDKQIILDLKNVKADKILISIPLRLWFSPAYRSKTDMWDRHYHEFEDWQLDWLLEKAGFKIVDRVKFTHPVKKLGFRPLLRWFTPRYYLVYAEREKR
jgi:hypothetical protein